MLKIGSHISSAKGYYAMGKQALKLKANTFAFFTRNPRGGSAKPIVEEDIKKYNELSQEAGFHKIVAHAPYTLNGCSADESVREFAWRTMAEDLKRMEYTPHNYYNFHPGSHVKQGVDVGIDYISQMLNFVLKKEQTTIVLLETMAGKGSEVGRTFEELKEIIDRINLTDRIGVCLDTCHVWDSGYDIVQDLDGVLAHFDKIIGLPFLKAIHLNDSMNDKGARKDRHAKIGEGRIGLEAMERIINHTALRELPFILETPNDDEGWAREIALLKSLYK
ncbi:deoxyribonuclease IV [Anaeropeptidivorans aminofermentans]|jgi:deoxyribonuclease-4|uniref:deoxyribonuclease IV n=1 Tax=Anaeropeptidivorans aminofermentans TaxID=2934315 RepID=UPI0020240BD2|nr:deoxyribonuclease IV [Anaeropeptidivorans aminofermentans]